MTMFKTLDEKRNEFTTRRERLMRRVLGSALAVLLLGGIYLNHPQHLSLGVRSEPSPGRSRGPAGMLRAEPPVPFPGTI